MAQSGRTAQIKCLHFWQYSEFQIRKLSFVQALNGMRRIFGLHWLENL